MCQAEKHKELWKECPEQNKKMAKGHPEKNEKTIGKKCQ